MRTVFFSDFDGTITQKDVIESIMNYFAPSQWKIIHKQLMAGYIDIDIGIKKMFNLIPSDKKDQIIQWCLENIKIRDGFGEFLEFLEDRSIPFVVLSGGLDFYMYPLLEKYLPKISQVFCNTALFDENHINVKFIYRCSSVCSRNCGVCKGYVIEKYYKNFNLKIYAGDGVTDLDACQYNDIIFSTGGLSSYLSSIKTDKRVIHFETFYDIINALKEMERESYYGKVL